MISFQKYPTLRYLILLILGIWIYGKFELAYSWCILLFSLCLLLGALSVWKNKLYFLANFLPFSFLFLGYLISHNFDQRNHISKFEKVDGTLVEIDSYTEAKEKTFKTEAKVYAVYENETWQPAQGKIITYFNHQAGFYPRYGDLIVLNGNLRKIEAPKNPYEFDYQQFLAYRNIFHHQFIRSGDFKKVGRQKSLGYYANQANVYAHQVFNESLEDPEIIGVAEAIVGGMRSELDREVLEKYAAAGVVHALAVSGLHVGILFWVLNLFFALFLDKKRLPFIISVLSILWLYAVFTGLSPSVCRATLMFTVFQIAMFLRRDGNSVNALFFSALVLLLIVPTWIYNVGFQLSYLAVLGILLLYRPLRNLLNVKFKPLRWLWNITCVSLAAQIFTLPLSLFYFHQFPNYFLLANPIVSLLCIPLLPSGLLLLLCYKIPLLGIILAFVLKWILILMNKYVFLIQSLPNALTDKVVFPLWMVFFLYGVLMLFLTYLQSRKVVFLKLVSGSLSLIFGFGIFVRFAQTKQAEITFHYIPKGSGISVIEGRSASFFAEDSLINEPLINKYHLKGYYEAKGIFRERGVGVDLGQNELISTGQGIIFWIKNDFVSDIPPTDYILISANAKLDKISLPCVPLILDGTNTKRYSESFKSKHPEAIILYDTGSKTFYSL